MISIGILEDIVKNFLSKKFRWKNSAERKVFELLRRKLGQEVTMEEVQSCGVAKETTSRTIESIARKLEIYNLEKNPVFKFTLERKRSIKDGRKLIAKLSCFLTFQTLQRIEAEYIKYQKNLELEEERKKTAELQKELSNTYFNLGNARADLKRYDEAIEALSKAVKLNPNNADYHFKWGEVFSKTEKFGEAEKELQKAIDLKPDYQEAYVKLGVTYIHLKKPKNAINTFNQIALDYAKDEIVIKHELRLKRGLYQVENVQDESPSYQLASKDTITPNVTEQYLHKLCKQEGRPLKSEDGINYHSYSFKFTTDDRSLTVRLKTEYISKKREKFLILLEDDKGNIIYHAISEIRMKSKFKLHDKLDESIKKIRIYLWIF